MTAPNSIATLYRAIRCVLILALPMACTDRSPHDVAAEATELLLASRAREALELLEPEIESNPESGVLHYLYGTALVKTGQIGRAEFPLRRALRDEGYAKLAAIALATTAIDGARPEDAIQPLSRALELHPEDTELLLLRADAYAASRVHLDEALEDAEIVLDLDPANLEALKRKARAYLAAARTEESAEVLEEIGARIAEGSYASSEDDAWYCTTMALFAQESFDTELAKVRWAECLDSHPTYDKAVASGVRFYDQMGDFERSIEVLQRAVAAMKVGPSLAYRINLATRLLDTGDAEAGEILLLAGVELENPWVASRFHWALADFEARRGNAGRALDWSLEAVEAQPGGSAVDPPMMLMVADRAILAGNHQLALEIAETIDFESFRQLIRARVAHERGQLEAALQLYDASTRLWPDNEFARYHAARAAESLGRFDLAIELYRHATRIEAGATDAQTRIAKLLDAQGDPMAALDVLAAQAARAALEPAARLLTVELIAQTSVPAEIESRLATSVPRVGFSGHGLARWISGLHKRGMARAAVQRLASIDVGGLAPHEFEPIAVAGLRAARESGQLTRVADWIERARSVMEGTTEFAVVIAILGELEGLSTLELGRQYRAVLARDDSSARARLGLARVLLHSDPAGARREALHAIQQETEIAVVEVHPIVQGLFEAGERQAAISVASALLERHPADGVAALLLARDALAHGEAGDRVSDWARRAARFDRSDEARQLIDRPNGIEIDEGQS